MNAAKSPSFYDPKSETKNKNFTSDIKNDKTHKFNSTLRQDQKKYINLDFKEKFIKDEFQKTIENNHMKINELPPQTAPIQNFRQKQIKNEQQK